MRHDVAEVVIRSRQPDFQGVTVAGLKPGDGAVVVETPGLGGYPRQFIQPLYLALEQELPGRAQLRVHEALETVDVIGGG